MCGIVGVVGNVQAQHETIFKQLLIVDSLRGIDSTGVAIISKNNEVKIAKDVGDPYGLFDTKSFDKAMLGANRVCIGHNRWGTVGGTNRKNAHPFQFDHITGVHNGTLRNKYALKDGLKFDVDSQALYSHISDFGVKDAISIAEGAWSLVWWDDVDQTLNFLRNEERPMMWTMTETGSQMFFASEGWMLEGVLGRNGVKHGEIVSTKEDWHYAFPVSKDGVIGKPLVSEVKGKPTPVYQGNFTNKAIGVQTDNAAPQQQARPTLSVVKTSEPVKAAIEVYNAVGHQSLEFVGVGVNKWGAKYFLMLDWNSPTVPIRLYFQDSKLPMKEDELISRKISCVVNPIPCTEVGVKFYKVNASSINWEDLSDSEIEEVDPVGSPFSKPIYSHTNNEISSQEFHNRYGVCCWCSGYVNPFEKHALTRDGESVCGECCEDSQLMSYSQLAGGVRNAN